MIFLNLRIVAITDKPVVRRPSRSRLENGGRVVAKVEFHFGALFPRAGFVITNLTSLSRKVVRIYKGRGTAEQWIKE